MQNGINVFIILINDFQQPMDWKTLLRQNSLDPDILKG
jgi:hypothetical protein